ncbi:non-ribosomal peptide synthetase [Limosilactobacillus reuteri]|uniref:non-ribosomal peptide synthetase n=1 Tax=Limosilactobacillus reuteri TaxID=1598 RepID=UPI001E591F34|nr:amino acid adenylation domain-containing protein [Limosilactobacillus reuteri]MCC4487565.1 amino acid adenylation domain-containing protein [Limosilactobacillus reuteri]
MFEEKLNENIKKFTNKVCVFTNDEAITYAELNTRIKILRNYFYKTLNPDKPVMILLERNINTVVTLITLYLMHISYIPLSTSYPHSRIKEISRQSGTSQILVDTETFHLLENNLELKINNIDNAFIKECTDINEFPYKANKKIAYIIFTSGSTGKPKGVMIKRSSVEAFLEWINQKYSLKEMSLVYSGTQITFDLSVFEIFGTLFCGGTIAFGYDDLRITDFRSHNITLINMVPSAVQALIKNNELPHSLRTINLAGEALSAKLAQKILLEFPKVKLYNLYGPTENTTYSTCYSVLDKDQNDVSIGRPITGCNIYLMTAQGIVKKKSNIKGEIILTGKLLAKGYLNDEQKTNEAFINITINKKTYPAYKTGDLGYFDKAGNLHYLGRKDSQVKHHGYRIELREIEKAAEQIKEVEKAIVLKINEDLVLFIANVKGEKTDPLRIKSFLEVPSYMIPEIIVPIKQWPLSMNGKIDRKKLEKNFINRSNLKQVSSNNFILDTVNSFMGYRKLNQEDNFLEQGFSSLSSVDLINKLNEHYQTNITLADVFNNPTCKKLARLLDKKIKSNHTPDKLNSFQQRMVYQYLLSPNTDNYLVKFAMDFDEPISIARANKAFLNLLISNPLLMKKVRKSNDGYKFSETSLPPEYFKVSAEKLRTIDPFKGPLITMFISNKMKTLNIEASHIIFDGNSINVFTDRFLKEYRSLM